MQDLNISPSTSTAGASLSKSFIVPEQNLVEKYNVSGPRYTSYPTALQFKDYNEEQLKQAIQDSPLKNQDLSLYFHIPFCATLCYYCACNKVVTRKKQLATDYLQQLSTEIDLLAPMFKDRVVSQLHWGGGTPTFLDNEQMLLLMEKIRAGFELSNDSEGEFSIEVDPRTVDAERIRHIRECGFNRISFGIQDFDPSVQKAVNRIQSFEDTMFVVNAARNYGFRSISVDLIYGLPHQTIESFSRTLDRVCELSPDRISIYNYAHLPDRFYPQKRILAVDLPRPEERLGILQMCTKRLMHEGYAYIGMDHFAKPDDELNVARQAGTLQRNFQGYSTHAETDLLGVGVTAISHIGNSFWQNEKDLSSYQVELEQGNIPVRKGVTMDADDIIRSFVIKSLICQFELPFSLVEKHFAINFHDYFREQLTTLQSMNDDGLITINDVGIEVTERGRFFIRNICMVFDRYLVTSAANSQKTTSELYSRAV